LYQTFNDDHFGRRRFCHSCAGVTDGPQKGTAVGA
jgi:hypothetical protein